MLLPTPPSSPLDLLLQQLTEEQREMVIAFARFLAHENERRAAEAKAEPLVPEAEPEVEPRPEGELPVHTIKRMRRAYPMLDGAKLLGRASELMMRHHVMGEDRERIVAEIEALFAAEYERWRGERG